MRAVVIGAGNWGTTLAILLAKNKHDVSLWIRDEFQLRDMLALRENKKYLEGIMLPNNIRLVKEFSESIKDYDVVTIAVPSHAVRDVSKKLKNSYCGQTIVCASKGFDERALSGVIDVIRSEIPGAKIMLLAGPIAREVLRGNPSVATLGHDDPEGARAIRKTFQSRNFRIHLERDIRGLELGSSAKNVIAIGSGICDGLGLESNTRGVVVAQGLNEIIDIGNSLGAKTETFYGLSVLGDLLTTSMSKDSRNRIFGEMVGSGISPEEAKKKIGMVVEGIKMCRICVKLSDKNNIEIPLIRSIYNIILKNTDPRKAIEKVIGGIE